MTLAHFVCIGNICRSPMAAAFANHYGSDVLRATSSGLSPARAISPETIAVMQALNIDVSRHRPVWYDPQSAGSQGLVVNLSGMRLPGRQPAQLLEWAVEDPYLKPREVYERVRDELERRVMELVLRLRAAEKRLRA
jgi:arsenate reductase